MVARYVDGKGGRPNLKLRPVLEMLEDHSHVKIIQTNTSGQACDQCDHPTDTFANNLDEENTKK
jgi:hypothetical protein